MQELSKYVIGKEKKLKDVKETFTLPSRSAVNLHYMTRL